MLRWLFTSAESVALAELQQRFRLQQLRIEELSTRFAQSQSAAVLVRVAELEAGLEFLQRSNRKELGKLWKKVGLEKNEIAQPTLLAATCENWAVAQREGPTSSAARCDCSYCETRRAEREHVRAQLVPKGPKPHDKGKH